MIPVSPEQLYRDLMSTYARFMRQGIAPSQIDDIDLEDLFTMLDCMRDDEQNAPASQMPDNVWF